MGIGRTPGPTFTPPIRDGILLKGRCELRVGGWACAVIGIALGSLVGVAANRW